MQLYDELDQTALHVHTDNSECPTCSTPVVSHISPAILEQQIADLTAEIKRLKTEALRRNFEFADYRAKANADLHWAAIREAQLRNLLLQSRKRIKELETLASRLSGHFDNDSLS